MEEKIASGENLSEEMIQEKVGNFRAYFRMWGEMFKKTYRHFPWGTVLGIVLIIIYFFGPIDLIPDYIPIFGYMDDVGVVPVLMQFTRIDIKEYKKQRNLK